MAKRGIQVSDVPSSLSVISPVPSAHIVAIGAAPLDTVPGIPWSASGFANMVNVAVLTEIPSDFTTQLGFSTTFGPGVPGAYSLSEVYDAAYVEARVSPVTCINVSTLIRCRFPIRSPVRFGIRGTRLPFLTG